MNPPIRILVVEDEAILAEDLRETLERQSYRVVATLDNAADARASVRNELPDLVMMDIHLAGAEDGISAASSIRDELDIPVIFLTAHSDHATLDRAKRSSPYGYLVKPFEDQELRASIETALYRHQSDAQLRKMERWLRTTLHSIGDGVITVDLDRRITFINPIAELITGWSRQAAIGQAYQAVFSLRDPKNQIIADPISPVLENGESLHFDQAYQIDCKDGSRRRIDDSVAPIRDGVGLVTGAIIIFRDATDKWELERLRLESEKRMQEAQRLESLGALAAGVAHDFNNMLAIIMGHTEVVAGLADLPAEAGPNLARVQDAALRSAHLCEQMLSYAENDSFTRKPIDLHPILEQTVKLLPTTLSKKIKINADFAPTLPFIDGHVSRLQQLISNLVMNGIEAMADKPGTLDVSARSVPALPDALRIKPPVESTAQSWLNITIEDEGHGMTEATLERIFDPFFTTKFTGRGLGLSIVFNVIRLHGGALAIQSAVDVGTRFDVYLPASLETVAPAAVTPPAGDWRPTQTGHVIIVDDEPFVREVLVNHLKKLGFTTDDTDEADEALEILQRRDDVTLVYLDLTMPKITGLEVLSHIRKTHPTLPVIFVSGFSVESVSTVLISDEHTRYLQKPFSRKDLISNMSTILP